MAAKKKTYDLGKRHVCILVPAYDGKLPIEFVVSYLETMHLFWERGLKLSLKCRAGCALIHAVRNELVYDGLREDVTDLMCVDSDIAWKPEDMLRLVAFGTEHPFVCGVYRTKENKVQFHASLTPDATGRPIQNDMGLLRANGVPAGFMLLRPSVIETVAAVVPCYVPKKGDLAGEKIPGLFNPFQEGDVLYGEDIAFCRRYVDAGGEIWIDPNIELDHIGPHTYTANYIEYLNDSVKLGEAA